MQSIDCTVNVNFRECKHERPLPAQAAPADLLGAAPASGSAPAAAADLCHTAQSCTCTQPPRHLDDLFFCMDHAVPRCTIRTQGADTKSHATPPATPNDSSPAATVVRPSPVQVITALQHTKIVRPHVSIDPVLSVNPAVAQAEAQCGICCGAHVNSAKCAAP
jgi:hypothetical protein